MIQLNLLIIAFLILASCHTSTNNNSTSEAEQTKNHTINSMVKSDFEKYLESLDTIPLPFVIYMDCDIPDLSKNYNKELYKKYQVSETSYPLGILFRSATNVVTLDLKEVNYNSSNNKNIPILVSFDTNGNLIDSLTLYKKSDAHVTYFGIEWVTIFANRQIEVLDTVTEWEYDEEQGDRVYDLYTTTTGKAAYEIAAEGNIIIK